MNSKIHEHTLRLFVFFICISIVSNAYGGKWRWDKWLVPGNPVKDFIDLHKKLFTSWSTYKTAVAFFPPFIFARMFDKDLQNVFYCRKHHKNKNQLPKWCHDICHWGVSLPMAILASTAFLAKDWELRTTGWVFLLGMPFVILGKDIFKSMEVDCNLRPWNQRFCRKKRALGGFPSGHMAELTYMAVLYGKRYGMIAVAPLAGFATFLGLSFVNCNRHYISQIIGGAALGTAYALAADKLISSKLSCDITAGFTLDNRGTPAFKISYNF
ncbi:phosphatase PAP2 family protein [Candidatus Dependentiae bacterium]|nr:phosphatase PAP2 family protein [Candidatus Dependentiae bacterium]